MADLTPLPTLGINRLLLIYQAFPMSFSPLIRQLIDGLRILPGVGQKTAQRMALQLLERDRSGGMRLAQARTQAMEGVGQ